MDTSKGSGTSDRSRRAAAPGRRPAVDLSADLGEGFGAWRSGDDDALLPVLTSAHIACGFHAGDPHVMRQTVRAAVEAGVVVGAHPSYPDLVGFGRRDMDVSAAEVADDLLYQLGALDAMARSCGARVRSVKPHGALYHRMAHDPEVARAIGEALLAYDSGIDLVAPAGSLTFSLLSELGVNVLAEGFCDRGYEPDGGLAPRGTPGALVTDPHEAARRALRLVREQRVEAIDGSEVVLAVDTLCVHGDTPGARAIAAEVRRALEEGGVEVAAGRSFTQGGADAVAG